MHISNGSDAQNAVASCLGYDDGIAVISGTGSIVFSQKDKQLIRFNQNKAKVAVSFLTTAGKKTIEMYD